MKRTRAPSGLLSVTAAEMLGNLVEAGRVMGQGDAQGPSPPASAKTIKCKGRVIPQPEDNHGNSRHPFYAFLRTQEPVHCGAMSGGILLLEHDRDGWPDIDLTCLGGNVLCHIHGDGTFTDVTAKAGVKDEGRMCNRN